MEILTGLPAGEKKPDGTFEEGTLNYLVDEKLAKTVELLRSFEAKEKEEEKREENTSENKEG
jgi:hypothetical protein